MVLLEKNMLGPRSVRKPPFIEIPVFIIHENLFETNVDEVKLADSNKSSFWPKIVFQAFPCFRWMS